MSKLHASEAAPKGRLTERTAQVTTTRFSNLGQTATNSLRLSLVVVFLIFGLEKFTKYAADGLQSIIVNSPITSWLNILGTQSASTFIGVTELIFGSLILYRFWQPASNLALAGAAGAVITFLTTLTFLLTTPDVIAPYGPPTPTLFGGFLVKDIVLLAASFVLLAQGTERRRAEREERNLPGQYDGPASPVIQRRGS